MTLLRLTGLALACACALGACGNGPAALSGTSPQPGGAALPSLLRRDEAIAVVRARTEIVGRVDRGEAKLLTWQEYLAFDASPGAINADPHGSPHRSGTFGFMGDADKRIVWIVALSGEVWPQMREPTFFGPPPHPSATPYTPYRWGLFVVDAARGGLAAIVDAGVDEPWPPLFAKLPDHPADVGAPAIADPCASLLHIPDVANPSQFAARTLADLTVNLPRDLAWMRLLQDVAAVRPNPMQDPRVPRCRVDLLRIGTPQFARAYPAASGRWFVPLVHHNDVLLTAFVDVDEAGIGVLSGNRGGAVPIPRESDARSAAMLPNDPVRSAELILARPPGCGANPVPVWRLLRASGTAVYFVLDVYGATPPGVLFEEKDMRFSSLASLRLASLVRAC